MRTFFTLIILLLTCTVGADFVYSSYGKGTQINNFDRINNLRLVTNGALKAAYDSKQVVKYNGRSYNPGTKGYTEAYLNNKVGTIVAGSNFTKKELTSLMTLMQERMNVILEFVGHEVRMMYSTSKKKEYYQKTPLANRQIENLHGGPVTNYEAQLVYNRLVALKEDL